MEGQATSPGASTATPATLSDLGRTSGHVGDSMPLDYTEQLLTPENSRSETSSNNENAPNDEKPTLRRSSSRVTRASLQRTTQPDTPEADNREGLLSPDVGKRNVTGQPPVNGLTNKKKSQSSLRHSLAVMESSQWNESALTRDPDAEDHLKEPDTPISNSSQEPQPTDMATSLQQRTLRKRVESALVKQETEGKGKPKTPRPINKDEPLRRSSRLSVVGRASALVDRAGSVLGKRSRDMMEMSKEVGRRAGLRPRNILKPKEDPIATGEIPATKRRRASAGDAPSVPKEKESTNQPVTPVRYKPKRWLSHGLYIGQEPVDGPPCQNRNKTTKRRRTIQQQRKYLPMPMFAGARLLSNGRDFKLPFDIFSPLPPGQPKPDEWRKTNKSMCSPKVWGNS